MSVQTVNAKCGLLVTSAVAITPDEKAILKASSEMVLLQNSDVIKFASADITGWDNTLELCIVPDMASEDTQENTMSMIKAMGMADGVYVGARNMYEGLGRMEIYFGISKESAAASAYCEPEWVDEVGKASDEWTESDFSNLGLKVLGTLKTTAS